MEYNRQHSAVPIDNLKRNHDRPHVVATAQKLGEMKDSKTSSARWPMASQIDPAAIVVLAGRIKEDDEAMHNVWYIRVVVQGHEEEGDDVNALLHIPRGTCKDLLTLMAKDQELCESTLITKWMPTAYNDQRILPKLNGWSTLNKAPKTLAIKPKAAGAGGKTKVSEREEVTGPIEATPPVKKGKVVAAAPPSKTSVAAAAPKVKAAAAAKAPVAKVTVKETFSKPVPMLVNPFDKAKAGKTPVAKQADAKAKPVASEPPTVQADAKPNPGVQPLMLPNIVFVNVNCDTDEELQNGEVRAVTHTYAGRDVVGALGLSKPSPKIFVPSWATSWHMELKLSSDPNKFA